MVGTDSCPMCGQEMDREVAGHVCAICKMGIPEGGTHFIVGARGRYATLCSPACVRSHVLIAESI